MKHIKEIVESVQANEGEVLTAGLKFLDENMGGLYPGELTVICGEADNEKTALMIRQINSLAVDKKTPVLMVLNGNNKRSFLACMAAYYCSIITEDVRKLFSDHICRIRVSAYMSMLKDSPLYIMEKDEFISQYTDLRPFVEERGIRAIFIENSRWLFPDEEKKRHLGQTLKQMAMKLNVVVVAEYFIWYLGNRSLSEAQRIDGDGILDFADNIINLVDYTAHDILVDDRGNDLRGLVGLRILKHKGELAKNKETQYQRTQLLVSNNHFADKLNKAAAKKLIQENKSVGKLISAFGCELVTENEDDDVI